MRLGALAVLALFLPGLVAAEASLSLVPVSGVYEVGTPFTLLISADAAQHPLNAAEGEIRFDTRDLRVERIDTADSLVATWATRPEAHDGVIAFSGWFDTRFTGREGRLFSVTFLPLRATEGLVSFTSGTLLSADVQETNVLASMRAARYVVRPAQVVPPALVIDTPEPVASATPALPEAGQLPPEEIETPVSAAVPSDAQAAASARAVPRMSDALLLVSAVIGAFLVGFGLFRIVRG